MKQVSLPENGIDSDAFAARFSLVIQHTKLNQSEFARRLDTSATFVGDVLRGLKKPGAEFLYQLNRVFSVSVDWLLTGKGTIHNACKVDVELMQAISLQVLVARLAIIENDATAQALLTLIREGLLDLKCSNPQMDAYLHRIRPDDSDWRIAIGIYNGHLWTDNPDFQRRNTLEAAISYFEVNQPVSKLASLVSKQAGFTQINIGTSQRIAGRDFHEGK
ncbi:helix-turn-helix transcriptional regulator [Methylophilus sp. YYY-1]|uniref:helix-turn-helix domain-containing protein n=1 Tax=Methylophilus sp. YYY-1 TaxID=2682087 RepID=UPI0023B3455F|nr:helix-turn-helix transcriptional regulator [Methylophilus sp. YYY-1]MDF0379020.1 helix-turn-helix domain-containing protein [Methylophilus sp. YYY-1]